MMKRQIFIGIDGKLDYLIYNGRLKGGKAFMGQMLNICPVIHFSEEGEIVALESVRTPKKALIRTCELLKEKIGNLERTDQRIYGRSIVDFFTRVQENQGDGKLT